MTRKPCCEKKKTNKGAWSKQEDDILTQYIHKHGEGSWRSLPLAAGLHRCGKSCRLRWVNYLRPDLKRGNFGEDEEDLIIKLHALLGNRWSLIAGRLPGRTDNEVKNYWNTHLRRKLVQMGVDPNNHRIGQSIIKGDINGQRLNITAAKPFGSSTPIVKINYRRHSYKRSFNGNDDDDGLTTSDESNTSCAPLPDLNLDLTIGLLPTSTSLGSY